MTLQRAIVLLAALALAAATARLGVWQLDRAAQKNALQAAIDTRRALPPLQADELAGTPAEAASQHHRPARLEGTWAPGATWFLDNRQMQGRPGFFVLTPLRLADGTAVLVQRGWVPRDFQDRQRLPEVPTPTNEVTLAGRLALPPSQLFDLGPGGHGPIRQNVSLSELAREWGVPLLEGVSVLQTGADGQALQRDWPRFVGDEHKHLAYAAQWFAMSAIVAGLYFWFQILQPRSRRKTHGTDAR